MEFLRVDPASAVVPVQVGVDPTTGSANVQVSIPLTPGRDGFGPSLSLGFGGYDPLSPFAHGWLLSGLPSIEIDARDGLPDYDGTERFRYAGQDLVPLNDDEVTWTRTIGEDEYDVRVFRARVESVRIRAERWTHSSRRVHWRVRTGDGSVQVFGLRENGEGRIFDPDDDSQRRTYRWLLEGAFDRLGNAMLVRYVEENDDGVDPLSLDAGRFVEATANRYPKRILYGNAAPLAEDDDTGEAEWFFEAVFDYGDHDEEEPAPAPSQAWAVRDDASFTGRLGFELRTRRLCRRVLMFHHFETELGEASTLVGSLELDHAEAPDATTLNGVRYVGWRTVNEARVSQPTPWATFEYTSAGTEDAFEVFEAPLLGPQTQLVDLFGEGLPGLLTLDACGVRFARNLGDGAFGAHELLPEWPLGLAGAALADFDGDGNVELVQPTGANAGYYRLDRRNKRWELLKRFDAVLNVEQSAVFQADMSGDGRADVVLVHAGGITWYPNRGEEGFGEPIEARLPPEKLPIPSPALERFVADMKGDGLADIVEVRNGSVRYWPNLGRGRFGEPIIMDDAPRLDAHGAYDPARVLLVDLDQKGASDLVYLRGDGVVLRAANRRGAAFGPLEPIAWGAPLPNGARVEAADVYGDGSSCLVVVAPSGAGSAAFHALRLTRSPGARQIQSVTHPLGAVSEVEWGHSVRHYLRDMESGRGWDTPLPAQRPVVDVLRRTEPIDDEEQSERFVYHDGHYDRHERSFALFAIVEHFDVDTSEPVSDVVPLLTKRFSHTGEFDYSSRFSRHHYAGDLEARPPPESVVEGAGLLDRDFDDVFRALLGTAVREELYATDGEGVAAANPIRIAESANRVSLTREAGARYRTSVQVVPCEARTSEYEQADEDPRVTIQRTLEVDEYLTPILTFQAGLARAGEAAFEIQARILATASKSSVEHADTEERFELAIPTETRSYEVHVPEEEEAFADNLADLLDTAFENAHPYDDPLELGPLAARVLTHTRVFYWNDEQPPAEATFGSFGAVVLQHHLEEAAYDRSQLETVFDTDIDPDEDLPDLGYLEISDVFYRKGSISHFGDAASLYRLTGTEAYDGGMIGLVADDYSLVTKEASDQVGNTTVAEIDYHVLAPFRLTDPNGTVQEIDYDPLGVTRRTARYGTALDASNDPVEHGFSELTFGAALPSFSAALADPEDELDEAESLFLYEYPNGDAPMRTLSLVAEEFVDRGPDASGVAARAQVSIAYFDGFGRELQSRLLVEPGVAWTEVDDELVEEEVETRWRVTGHVVKDAKQQARQSYEPFFRDEHEFEPEVERRQFGVASTISYDALGRVVRQDVPNGTFSETIYAAWSRTNFDPNDRVDQAIEYIEAREELDPDEPEYIVLQRTLEHADTPISVHFDALGREIATVEVVETEVDPSGELVERAVLEIRGLSEATVDREELAASSRGYDRLGRMLFETSMDAGTHRSLYDAEGREVKHWHEDTEEERIYDVAGRLEERHMTDGATSWLAEELTYGEGLTGAADKNQLGRLVTLRDGAGEVTTTRFGAFGEPLEVERTLTEEAGLDPDWAGSVSLETTSYVARSAFDALGRKARALLQDGTERRFEYLRSGPTTKLEIDTPGTPNPTVHTILVETEYNARGQQVRAVLGNEVVVTSTYDAQSFRLYRRLAVYDETDTYQDLRHHYDPVGHLVYLDDLAQSPTADHVIDGLIVTAERLFTYDARYQLIEATGRVHDSLMRADYRGDPPTSGSFRGTRRVQFNDGGEVSRYVREFEYDKRGNLTGWSHNPEGTNPGNSWTEEKWVSSSSNRSYQKYDLNDVEISDPGQYFDARGQITELPNVRAMEWSVRDQLRKVTVIERSGHPNDEELYDYAADGKRLRKTTKRVVDLPTDTVETTETIYLDGFEFLRIKKSTVLVERWSSHIEDGETRLATVYHWDTDTLERETDDVDAVQEHYHLGTHLGDVSLELGASGELLSYEEYFPYGRTAFMAGDAVLERTFRTLRFVGKNQDDSTGFYVFQFRYYAPFIGNWVSPDPAAEIDGPNRYQYCHGDPVNTLDRDGLFGQGPGPQRDHERDERERTSGGENLEFEGRPITVYDMEEVEVHVERVHPRPERAARPPTIDPDGPILNVPAMTRDTGPVADPPTGIDPNGPILNVPAMTRDTGPVTDAPPDGGEGAAREPSPARQTGSEAPRPRVGLSESPSLEARHDAALDQLREGHVPTQGELARTMARDTGRGILEAPIRFLDNPWDYSRRLATEWLTAEVHPFIPAWAYRRPSLVGGAMPLTGTEVILRQREVSGFYGDRSVELTNWINQRAVEAVAAPSVPEAGGAGSAAARQMEGTMVRGVVSSIDPTRAGAALRVATLQRRRSLRLAIPERGGAIRARAAAPQSAVSQAPFHAPAPTVGVENAPRAARPRRRIIDVDPARVQTRSVRWVRHRSGLTVYVEQGPGGRIEYARARLSRAYLDLGTETNPSSRRLARLLGLETDDAGHVAARRLGGEGGVEVDNIVSQHPRINQVDVNQFEAQIYDWVVSGDNVHIEVRYRYGDPSHLTRYTEMEYTVIRNGVVQRPRTFGNQ